MKKAKDRKSFWKLWKIMEGKKLPDTSNNEQQIIEGLFKINIFINSLALMLALSIVFDVLLIDYCIMSYITSSDLFHIKIYFYKILIIGTLFLLILLYFAWMNKDNRHPLIYNLKLVLVFKLLNKFDINDNAALKCLIKSLPRQNETDFFSRFDMAKYGVFGSLFVPILTSILSKNIYISIIAGILIIIIILLINHFSSKRKLSIALDILRIDVKKNNMLLKG
ncbi:hypothetical protein [Limosilactobacillus urinaemulieris]|uniref:hypothetical protein n=1 Tax=Limosilactobacillus urinaemulieris TaxID=2742600 RepID=UPI001F58D7A8|nr:hypothetical protein [Limosilactobacillus urinaemulieris]